jgi:hypothetical protein
MNEEQLTRVINNLAESLVPAEIDLWPTIRERLETSKHFSALRELSKGPRLYRNRSLRLVSALLMVLVVAIILLFATPQGRALSQGLIQFFIRAPSDELPRSFLSTPYPTPGPNDPTPGPYYEMRQTVQEVQIQAGFHIFEPTYLPDSLSFTGALFDNKLKIARIFYSYQPIYTNGLLLREERYQRNDNCELCGWVGASAPVDTVQIGAVAGEYVEGAWHLTDKGPVWEQDPYLKTLRWKNNGMAFELQYMGPDDSLTKEQMIAIAVSLK